MVTLPRAGKMFLSSFAWSNGRSVKEKEKKKIMFKHFVGKNLHKWKQAR
jgi:hypothetical protein